MKLSKRPWNRCEAVLPPNETAFWGRCDRERHATGDHILERGMFTIRWFIGVWTTRGEIE